MFGIHTPCKNKHPKGSVKPFLSNIYGGLGTLAYKKNNRAEANRAVHRSKYMGESALS